MIRAENGILNIPNHDINSLEFRSFHTVRATSCNNSLVSAMRLNKAMKAIKAIGDDYTLRMYMLFIVISYLHSGGIFPVEFEPKPLPVYYAVD